MAENLNILQRAVIRNARICSAVENIGLSVVFDQEFDTKLWTGTNITMVGASGGFLFLSATTESPNIFHSTGFAPLDAERFTQVVVRYKYVKNRTDSVASKGIIQFQTIADSTWSADKQEEFDVNSDGKWHKYVINMGPVAEWVGFISNIRIFFATDGAPSDEIFITDISIQSPIFQFCAGGCVDDSSRTLLGQSFNDEQVGTSPADWSRVNTGAGNSIYLDYDPAHVNSNNLVSRLSTSGPTTPGPKMLRGITPHSKGFFSCRFRTTSDGTGVSSAGKIRILTDVLSDLPSVEINLDTDGTIKYRSGSTYASLPEETAFSPNTWYDLLITYDTSTLRADVFIDGESKGTEIPVVFQGFIRGVAIEHPGGAEFDVFVDDVLVVDFPELNISCPGMGRQGQIKGEPISFSFINIIKDYNDTFIVNMDGYGDIIIKLFPENNIDSYRMRFLLERAISSVDVAGYTYSEVDYIDGRFIIRSGTYSFDSVVVIKASGSSPLAESLGFIHNGEVVGSITSGRPHAAGFSFVNNFRATSYDLTSILLDQEDTDPVVQDPRKISPLVGESIAGFAGSAVSIDGRASTVIDFYNRANSEGIIKTIRLHGVVPRSAESLAAGSEGAAGSHYFDTGRVDLADLFIKSPLAEGRDFSVPDSLVEGAVLRIDTPGYPGNGEYVIESINPISSQGAFPSVKKGVLVLPEGIVLPVASSLNWEILRVSKLKLFRPRSDGSMDLINEVDIGLEEEGLLYTRDRGVYEIGVNWHVIRGDLIGIYNASQLFAGNSVLQIPDALYIQEEGDLRGENLPMLPPSGVGIEGIGLFGKGEKAENLAVYDIDLKDPVVIEALEVKGFETVVDLEYNILSAINNGVSVSVDTHGGTHRHLAIRGSTGIAEEFIQDNIAYNISALTDGTQFAVNGLVGTLQQDDPRSPYFYVNGDAEWADLEFPQPTWIGVSTFDFEEDPITFSFSWFYKKSVHRMRFFFKEFPSLMGYQIEYLDNPQVVYNGSSKGFRLIGGFDEANDVLYETVKLDDRLYERDVVLSASGANPEDTHVHYKHFAKKYDVHYKGPRMTVSEKRNFDAALYHPYRILDKIWQPISTKALNVYSFYHYSTKISEIEIFSKTSSESDLQDILSLYFSDDGEEFFEATPVKIDEETVRFVIGTSVRYLRLLVSPFGRFTLDRVVAIPDSDLIRFKDTLLDKPIKAVDLDLVKGQESPAKQITITNKTGSVADVQVSIETTELESNVLLKSSLNSLEDIENPEYGPPGQVFLDENFDLPVVQNVAVNSKCYGLRNIAVGKTFYTLEDFNSESDLFGTGIDSDKWILNTTNFPHPLGSKSITFRFPSFQMIGDPPGEIKPQNNETIIAELVSKWRPLGSFIATISAEYDASGAGSNPLGSEIGIVDSSGRKISIRRERVSYGSLASPTSYATYVIEDSINGVLDTLDIFCDSGCSPAFGNPDDHLVPYDLRVRRINDPAAGTDLLRFYFNDELNFDGIYQWTGEYDSFDPNEDLGYEIDLSSLITPLVEPVKIFIKNFWTEDGPTSSFGSPLSSDGNYVRINTFKYLGDSNFSKNSGDVTGIGEVGPLGQIGVDNYVEDPNTVPVKSVVVDLGKYYALDLSLLKIYNHDPSSSITPLWDVNKTLFSDTNTSNPLDVRWGDVNIQKVRWVMFQELSTSNPLDLKALHAVRVYPDVTLRIEDSLVENTEWDDLGSVLTNGDLSLTVSQVEYPVLVVRLANQFATRNYKVLSKRGSEYPIGLTRQLDFTGWQNLNEDVPNFFTTVAHTLTENPAEPVWRGWSPYPPFTVGGEKGVQTLKWIAIKNTLLNTSQPYNDVQEVAGLEVTTEGLDFSDLGQQVDRVDFTEYAEWFDTSLLSERDISLLDSANFDADGLLYGSSETTHPGYGFGDKPLGAFNVFDGDPGTSLLLRTDFSSTYFYRIFGTISGAAALSGTFGGPPVEEDAEVTDDISSVDLVAVPEGRELLRIELGVTDNTSQLPRDLEVQTFTGTDPEVDSHWLTVSGGSYTDIHEEFGTFIDDPDAGGVQGFITEGQYFIHQFIPPVVSSGIRIKMTDFEPVAGRFQTCNIDFLRLIEPLEPDSTGLLDIDNDISVRAGGRRSLKLTYPSGGIETRRATVPESFHLQPDAKWLIQDFLGFYMKINNLSELDLDNSYIRVGRDSGEFYQWHLSQVNETVTEDLTLYTLRFKDAVIKGGDADSYELTANLEDLAPQTRFRTEGAGYFEIGLKPKLPEASSDITVWFDNFSIIRENSTLPGLYNDTIYLGNAELIYFPLASFDMRKGFFECIITPDWDREGTLEVPHVYDYGDQVYSIFSVVNGSSEYMGLYYTSREQEGLTFVINTPDRKLSLVIGEIVKLRRYNTHLKISLLWDNDGTRIDARSGATVRLYLDDILIGDLSLNWEITETRDTYFLIGGRAYSQAASSPIDRQFVEFGFNVELRPVVSSLTGGIENLVISSEPIKLEFDKIQSLKDKILISLDGINYYSGNSTDLPLTVNGVPADGEVNLYIKTNFPKDTSNMPRDGFIKTRWLKKG